MFALNADDQSYAATCKMLLPRQMRLCALGGGSGLSLCEMYPHDNTSGKVLCSPASSVDEGVAADVHVVVVGAAQKPSTMKTGSNGAKLIRRAHRAVERLWRDYLLRAVVVVCDFVDGEISHPWDDVQRRYRLSRDPPSDARETVEGTARVIAHHVEEMMTGEPTPVVVMPCAAWVHERGPLRAGVRVLGDELVYTTSVDDTPYPSEYDDGKSYELAIRVAALRALGRDTRDEQREMELARRQVRRLCSAGGTATMNGPHARRIQSAGGKATMNGPHASRISSAGGKACRTKRLNAKPPKFGFCSVPECGNVAEKCSHGRCRLHAPGAGTGCRGPPPPVDPPMHTWTETPGQSGKRPSQRWGVCECGWKGTKNHRTCHKT